MFLKITVCDNDELVGFQIENYLECMFKNLNIKFETEIQFTGEGLCTALESGTHYDLIFLDVNLGTKGKIGLNGIQIGKKIREEYNDLLTPIIYISTTSKHAVNLIQYHPLDFLLKPLNYERFEKAINKFLKIMNFWSYAFIYNYGHDTFKVKINDIRFLRSNGKKVEIFLQTGKMEYYYGNLGRAYKEQLTNYDFLYIHRAYIVNYDYISVFQYSHLLLMDGQTLPISQPKRMDIKKRYKEIEKKRIL